MKIVTYLLILTAIVLIVYNATILDPDNLLEGDSQIALIGILAASCVILLLVILNVSKRIARKKK